MTFKQTGGTGRHKLFENVDGIKFLSHQGGCGGTREDAGTLCGLIAGYIHHPNVAGATILSLGCQNAQVPLLRNQIQLRDPHFAKPLFIFEQQQSGSEFKMLSEAGRVPPFWGWWKRTNAAANRPRFRICALA